MFFRSIRHGPSLGPMPFEFEELADYNSRKYKGILHTKGYEERMAKLQEKFNEWQEASQDAAYMGSGWTKIGKGHYVR